MNFKKGNNVIEYVLLIIAAGIVIGYALSLFTPGTVQKFFGTSFGNTTQNDSKVIIEPLTE